MEILIKWIGEIRGKDFRIRTLRSDSALEFLAIAPSLFHDYGITHDVSGPGQYCPYVGRKLRSVKILLWLLAFVVFRVLLRSFVEACGKRLNYIPGLNALGGIRLTKSSLSAALMPPQI